MVAMPLCQAVSDTDVYLIKAEVVTFEEEKITIVGSASSTNLNLQIIQSFNENLRPKNYEEGIPLTAFWVENIEAEYKRLKDLGVEFRSEAMDYGLSTAAILDDTCGNLIMIYQENKK